MTFRNDIEAWYLKKAKANGAALLPSIRASASELGVSTRTVYLAVQALKACGELESRLGGGIYVAGTSPKTILRKSSQNMQMKGVELSESLQIDLRQGKLWADGLLPAAKSLAQVYKVSQPTLRKVLRQFCADGILERQGSRYRLAGLTHQRKEPQTIRLLIAANEKGLRLETPREFEFLRILMDEIRAMGIRLDIVGVNDYGALPLYFTSSGIRRDLDLKSKGYLGTILSTWHMKDAWQNLRSLLAEGLPVSVWVEGGRQDAMAKRFGRRSLCTFFDVGYGLAPGRVVGKYLESKGHKASAYISPFHGSEWSKQRLRGLENSCRTAHIAITVFVLEDATDPWTYRHRAVGNKVAYMPQHLDAIAEHRIDIQRDKLIAKALEPLFHKALSDVNISTWVLANDLVGFMAQDFLAKNSSAKRKPIELVSFDNTPETYARRISSYEFNTHGMTLDMLYHIVAPKSPLFAKPGVIHLDGRVVEKS